MFKKIICFTALFVASASAGICQKPPHDLYPVVSKREDVVKALKEGKAAGRNKEIYNLPDEEITFTYYQSGCSAEEERRLSISPGAVLEIKVAPKVTKKLGAISFTVYDINLPLTFPDKMDFNSREGILVITQDEVPGDRPSYSNRRIKELHFVTPQQKLSECLAGSFDETSGYALLMHQGLRPLKGFLAEFPPVRIGSYFEEDSDASKKEGLDILARRLSEYPTGVAHIVLFSWKKEKISRRCDYVRNYLKKKGVEPERLFFINGGSSQRRMTHLAVVFRGSILLKGITNLCPAKAR